MPAPLITTSFRRPIEAFTDVGERPAIVMPLCANDSVLGVIAVTRNESQPPFDDSYLNLVSDFARHAAIALTLSNARDRQHELTVLADRERIAHDLHDHVIQRLFAAGAMFWFRWSGPRRPVLDPSPEGRGGSCGFH